MIVNVVETNYRASSAKIFNNVQFPKTHRPRAIFSAQSTTFQSTIAKTYVMISRTE